MLLDANLEAGPSGTRSCAAELDAAGYDGIWVPETKHDPFLQVLHATHVTSRASLGTGIAVAFARSPMTVAHSAYDLNLYAQGRFILGLGSQVRPHITQRFSMPWSHPAARMREFVFALRAIWASWEDDTQLDFCGEHYQHTLMTPFFTPGRHDFGNPPVYLAGVGQLMTEVAAEVCDGFIYHPFTTDRYLHEVTLPALKRGRSRAGIDDLDGFSLSGPTFLCVGRDDDELAAAIAATKARIAFYASTPAYRPVLDLHGWGDLQPALAALSKTGRWSEMGDLIDDEVLQAFAMVGGPVEACQQLRQRRNHLVHRTTIYAPYEAKPELWSEVIEAFRT